MKFVFALASLFTGSFAMESITKRGAIPANSKIGLDLIGKARRIADEEQDATWVAGYEIKFQGCHHMSQWNEEAEDAEDVRIETLRLVRFRLCPVGSCSDESGYGCRENFGDYIIDMNTYVQSFLEFKEQYEEEICKDYEENYCICEDNGDDNFDEDTCKNQCLAAANMSYCIRDEDALQVNDYLECGKYEPPEAQYYGNRKLENAEEEYYLGPYCADQGGEIHLGFFDDETCTNFADAYGYGGRTTFEKISNGATMPYSSSSLIDTKCWSCKMVDENNDNNQNEPTEFCENTYAAAGKCEQYLNNGYSENNNACNYLEGIKMTRKNGIIISGSGSKNKVAAAFIGIFAVSFVLLGSYVYYLKSKLDRGRIHLSD